MVLCFLKDGKGFYLVLMCYKLLHCQAVPWCNAVCTNGTYFQLRGVVRNKRVEYGEEKVLNSKRFFVKSSKINTVRCVLWATYCYRRIRITNVLGHTSGREGYSRFVMDCELYGISLPIRIRTGKHFWYGYTGYYKCSFPAVRVVCFSGKLLIVFL